MSTAFKILKKGASKIIRIMVIRQKNEWPATSVPVFFQPYRPYKASKKKQLALECIGKVYALYHYWFKESDLV